MVIKVYANDGAEFKGDDYTTLVTKMRAYEDDQKVKKEKEEAERKTREEKQKHLTQYKQKRLNEIGSKADELNELLKKYREDYKTSLYITYNLDNGVKIKEVPTLGDLLDTVFDTNYYCKQKQYQLWQNDTKNSIEKPIKYGFYLINGKR